MAQRSEAEYVFSLHEARVVADRRRANGFRVTVRKVRTGVYTVRTYFNTPDSPFKYHYVTRRTNGKSATGVRVPGFVTYRRRNRLPRS